jgi:hypothetical protein
MKILSVKWVKNKSKKMYNECDELWYKRTKEDITKKNYLLA